MVRDVLFRPRVAAGGLGLLVLVGITRLRLPAETLSGHVELPLGAAVRGSLVGITYGLLAVGIVLIYRTSRIINFAHGQTGAFAAAIFGLAVTSWHIPYWLALPFALLLGAGISFLAELICLRLLRNVPRIMSVVATLAYGAVLVQFAILVNSKAQGGSAFPQPPGMPTFHVGTFLVTQAYGGMLVLGPLSVAALAFFLQRTRYGLGMRVSSANPEAARMAGIFASRMSSTAWLLAGAFSALTAILTQPTLNFASTSSFGPSLLLRALAAAAAAGMTRIPMAMTAGIAFGIVEELVGWNYRSSGVLDAFFFLVIMGVLLANRRTSGREAAFGSWAAVQALRPVSDEVQGIWLVRNLGRVVAVVALVAAAMLSLVITNSFAVVLSSMCALIIVGLSLGIVSGLLGQLSLGQFAVASIGAAVSVQVGVHHGGFLTTLLYAAAAGAIASLLLGLPALRGDSLVLTVTTLAFSLVTPAFVLRQSWLLGDGTRPRPPRLFGHDITPGRPYFLLSLAALAVALLVAGNIWRSGLGRLFLAVRDNESNARAFSIPATTVKLQAFGIAGALAGVGGAIYAHGLAEVAPQAFPASLSFNVVVMLVLGGASLLSGPVLGAFVVVLLPALAPNSSLIVFSTALGWLLLVINLPGGLGSLVEPLRDAVVARIARRRGLPLLADDERGSTPGPRARLSDVVASHSDHQLARGGPLLEAVGLKRSFGGIAAVRDVSLVALPGEIVGLIGPNGAGKTTTFELLSGFTQTDEGTVVFLGDNVTAWSPERRAQQGLIRSFQDAALFSTLTVRQTVMLALERSQPTRSLASAAGLSRPERVKRSEADEIISLMGLGRYARRQIAELSTGTRRLTEIACLLAMRPTLLLLDEPSSGVAQRETEALGLLLGDIRAELDVAMLIIEHDIPLIMGLADRMYAMADGRIIASGTPAAVRHDPQVVESYLGGDIHAIERSDTATRSGIQVGT